MYKKQKHNKYINYAYKLLVDTNSNFNYKDTTMYYATVPPSTGNTAPVMYDASLLQRNNTASAASLICAKRPSGFP